MVLDCAPKVGQIFLKFCLGFPDKRLKGGIYENFIIYICFPTSTQHNVTNK